MSPRAAPLFGILVLAAVDCSRVSSPDKPSIAPTAAPGSGSVSPAPSPRQVSRVEPSALVGCRAPDEPGCAKCCVSRPDSSTVLAGEDDWSQYPGVEPWYNSGSAVDSCAADYKPCASCLERDEQQLMHMLPLKCDCEHLKIGIDPCFSPNSCECICENYIYLSRQCPHVVN